MTLKTKLLTAAGALTLAGLGITGVLAAQAGETAQACPKSDCVRECPKDGPCVRCPICPGR